MEYRLLLTFSPPYYPSKCSESHAEYAPLPRIVYFVGKWAISGHPWATIFMVNEKSVRVQSAPHQTLRCVPNGHGIREAIVAA